MDEITETQSAQCAGEPVDRIPLTGFYGGKLLRISLEYDDQSFTNIGNPESVSLIVSRLETLYAEAK